MFMNNIIVKGVVVNERIDTSNLLGIAGLVYNATALTNIDIAKFNTSNVVDMESMFCDCDNLKEIKFSSKFNTAKVTKMTRMFCLCESLTELDLTSFDTRNTTLMNYLFEYCGNLKTIYVTSGKWSTSQANTHKIFSGCGTSTVTYK